MEFVSTLIIIPFELFVACLVVSCAFSAGLTLLNFFKINHKSRLEEVYLAFLLGYCALSTFTMSLGYLALLYSPLFWVLTLVWLVIQKQKLFYLINFLKEINFSGFVSDSRLNLFSFLLWGVVFLFGLSLALLPLSTSDAQAMHMAYGALFKTNHKVIPLHFFLGGFWPHLSEMIWLFCTMLYKSSIPVLLVNLKIFFLIAVGVFLIARKFVSQPFAYLAASLFLVSTNSFYQFLMFDVKEEFLLAALATGALFCLFSYFQDRSIGKLTLLACFVGFTGATKNIYGLVPAFAILISFVVSDFRSKEISLKYFFRNALFVSIISGMILIPWYFGQVFYRSNIFYPFNLFQKLDGEELLAIGSDPRSKENDFVFTHQILKKDDAADLVLGIAKNYVTFFWRMTKSEVFGQTLTFGFLFLLIITPFIKRPNWNSLCPLLVYIIVLYSIYFLGPSNNRRFIPMFAAWSIFGMIILANIFSNRKKLGEILLVVLMGIMAHSVYQNYLIPKPYGGLAQYFPVIINPNKRKEFLNHNNFGLIDIADYINSKTSSSSKFFLYPLIPGYYFDRNYIWGDKLHAGEYLGYSRMKEWKDLLDRLKTLKITHIIFNAYGYNSRPHYQEELPNKWVPETTNHSAYYLYGSDGPTSIYSIYKLSYEADVGAKIISESFVPVKTGKGTFHFELDKFSPDKEYQVEGFLEAEDMNEYKTQSPGDLKINLGAEQEVKTVGRVYININSKRIKNKIHFKFLITPYLTGNGEYEFSYRHYPSYGAVKLESLQVNAFEKSELH